MGKKKNHRKVEDLKEAISFEFFTKVKRQIGGILMILLALVVLLSFFNQAGVAGQIVFRGLKFLIGNVTFFLPLVFVLAGLVFFFTSYQRFFWGLALSCILLVLGLSSIFETLNSQLRYGGYLGYWAKPLLGLFGFWVSEIIFSILIIVAGLFFWHLLSKPGKPQKISIDNENPLPPAYEPKKPSFIKKIFFPKFKVKEIAEKENIDPPQKEIPKAVPAKLAEIPKSKYKLPPLDLLDAAKGSPAAGDIRNNSVIIKKTMENFGIPVEMSEINIGPTVTQYTFKPSEGIKLSKITGLSNDLALALATHPIRIEAPVPGKSLVGIEMPNKVRAQVRLKDLVSNPQFQNSAFRLTLCLGKDVAGTMVFSDLARMPHLLVAGSTGTGKTIFLNNLILSLLYHNSPETMRMILVDPKRVEFPVYQDLPHLLCPVILDPSKTVGALKWLILEMERRFEVLSAEKTRDIISYNEVAYQKEGIKPLPYIVVIIDELADLMASRGKEVEGGIVRLAQMARAVGIHLIVATQRPSVEVITGLIKANITARVTFQVASQIDSRTVLDSSGAEKLLGAGDLLFVSAEVGKPKRIQGAYVSDKEIKRVVNFIKTENPEEFEKIDEAIFETQAGPDFSRYQESANFEFAGGVFDDEPLLEEAKRLVVEAKKASASLLQRRLRIGYARAARLLDLLEEKGIVGPAEGAKPRIVFLQQDIQQQNSEIPEAEKDDWQKV